MLIRKTKQDIRDYAKKIKRGDLTVNPKYNSEGYPDPTAFAGIKSVIKEETDVEKRANDLIKHLKYVISLSGFELIERIKFRDNKSGREFK